MIVSWFLLHIQMSKNVQPADFVNAMESENIFKKTAFLYPQLDSVYKSWSNHTLQKKINIIYPIECLLSFSEGVIWSITFFKFSRTKLINLKNVCK